MQFKRRVSTLAVHICIIHTETRQIPKSFHYNPIVARKFSAENLMESAPDVYGFLSAFFTETLIGDDMKGCVWIASFIFIN